MRRTAVRLDSVVVGSPHNCRATCRDMPGGYMSRPGQQLQRGAEGGRARHGARGRAKSVATRDGVNERPEVSSCGVRSLGWPGMRPHSSEKHVAMRERFEEVAIEWQGRQGKSDRPSRQTGQCEMWDGMASRYFYHGGAEPRPLLGEHLNTARSLSRLILSILGSGE
jgi:hypothetical protein